MSKTAKLLILAGVGYFVYTYLIKGTMPSLASIISGANDQGGIVPSGSSSVISPGGGAMDPNAGASGSW